MNEVNRKESSLETPSGSQNPLEEELAQSTELEARVAELERLVARRDEELTKAKAQLAELEPVVTGKDSEIATLKQTRDELEEKAASISSSLAGAISSYKAAVVQANPEVIAELVSGDTIEAVNQSLQRAKALVSKVRQGIEAEISLTKVPAGAPERTPPDFSTLSPREKIQRAIGGFPF